MFFFLANQRSYTMKCPFCGSEMVEGTIYGDRYQLKWLPKTQKLTLGVWVKGGLALGKGGFLGRSRVESSLCSSCQKMVIDLTTAEQ
jgi:hypothetical protein